MGRLAVVRALLMGFVLSACLQPGAVKCSDGRVCPDGTTCAAEHGLCLVSGQAEACDALADGDNCSFGTQAGVCDRGICVATLCGNSVIEGDEVCDDGNVVSGDGCRGDCGKAELCGDAIVDANEDCDDGNLTAVDGCDTCRARAWTATAIIGGAPNALSVGLQHPVGVVLDARGNLYILDASNRRVRRIDPTGVVTTVAGTGGGATISADGVRATSVDLPSPVSITVDGLGNLYVASYFRVRRVDTNGIITTVAGTGATSSTYSGDLGPAINARISQAEGLAVDGLGNLYISDTGNHRIRRVDVATGTITTVGGTGTAGLSGDGGLATQAMFDQPMGIAFHNNAIYVADRGNHRIRKIDEDGIVTTVAGTTFGFSGDGGLATSAMLQYPRSIGLDAAGNLFIADVGNGRIRRVGQADGIISTVAGSGSASEIAGDGGPAVDAKLSSRTGIAVANDGQLYIADQNFHRVRHVNANGIITTIAGSGSEGYAGEGALATSVAAEYPEGLTVDGTGRLLFTDTQQFRVRRVDENGIVTTIAGTTVGFSGDGGPAVAARFAAVTDVDVDANGNIYIVDSDNRRIRRIDSSGIVTTIAGGGTSTAEGVPATTALLGYPRRAALFGGSLYFSEPDYHRVKRVDANGIVTTVAGTTYGFSGDGGQANVAQLARPHGLAFDAAGNLYIADSDNNRVRRVSPTGEISTVAGSSLTGGFAGDDGPATSALLDGPTGVAIGPTGDLYIADQNNSRVRRVSNSVITTIAGSGVVDFGGDGGPATAADLDTVHDVALDAAGNLYVSDSYNGKIRLIDTAGLITTAVGQLDPENVGAFGSGRLADARALVATPAFTLIAGGGTGVLLAARTAPAILEVVAGRYPHTTATGNLARFRDYVGSYAGVAYDAVTQTIYATEATTHSLHAISVVDPADENTWTITTLAGGQGFVDGALSTATFRDPAGLFWDAASNRLYVADPGNHVIRAIDLGSGTASTVIGVAQTRGFAGDGGVANAALLYEPRALTRCANGDIFVADTGNHRIRRIASGSNTITTVLGDGVAGSSGEGAPAWTFPVQSPLGVACDDAGNLYVTSTNSVRLLPADATGVVDGNGPVQTIYGAPPRDAFPASVTTCLTGITAVAPGTVHVVDACAGLLVELALE